MKHLLLSLLIFGFGISGSLGQTIKTLGYNTTNGQVVANTGLLTFTNETVFATGGQHVGLVLNTALGTIFIPDNDGQKDIFYFDGGFDGPDAQLARANLGFSTNLNTLWTAANASNARSAVGLGATNIVEFNRLHLSRNANSSDYTLSIGQTNTGFRGIGADTNDFGFYRSGAPIWYVVANNLLHIYYGLAFNSGSAAATTRTNLGLGWPALTNTNAATSLLGFNTNGQVVYSGTNLMVFTNAITAQNIGFFAGDFSTTISGGGLTFYSDFATNIQSMILFEGDQAETMRTTFRANLGFSTNLNTLWTAANASNARSAVGLGATNIVEFRRLILGNTIPPLEVYDFYAPMVKVDEIDINGATFYWDGATALFTLTSSLAFNNSTNAAVTRTNLGLGGGITATKTFVSYNGTNYTTNSVTISNGVITGWTQ